MGNSYSDYIRQVKRALDLPWYQRKELLQGLQLELEEKFPESTSTEILIRDVGQPEEVAQALLEAIDLRERTQRNFLRLQWFCGMIVSLGLLLVLSIGAFLYFDLTWVGRAEVTITDDAMPSQYSTIIDERP